MNEIKKKVCKLCETEKDILSFSRSARSKDGFDESCKLCKRNYNNKLYAIRKDKAINPEKYTKEKALTKICNRCKMEKEISFFSRKTLNSTLYSNCHECRLEYDKELYAKKQTLLGLKVRAKRPSGTVSAEQKHEEMLERCERYRARHLERRRKSSRDWGRRNMAKQVKYNREKYHSDPIFNLKTKIRKRILNALRGCKNGTRKTNKTIKLLGCSFLEFKEYIEKLLEPGMSWNDVMTSKIHLDHSTPLNSYDLTDPEQQSKAFHFTNIFPRWATTDIAKEHGSKQIGNLNKGRKILSEEQLLAERIPLDFGLPLL